MKSFCTSRLAGCKVVAIIFELWAECGDRMACEAFARHCDGLRFDLLTGKRIEWKATVEVSFQTVGVRAWAPELSRSGVRTITDALEATESGLRMYQHLKTAPPFRFARIDWEAANIPVCDLKDFIDNHRLCVECVMDDGLYDELGAPNGCYPFREAYRWTQYRGESYRPLYSNDQPALNDLCRKIFPEYFDKA